MSVLFLLKISYELCTDIEVLLCVFVLLKHAYSDAAVCQTYELFKS